MPDAAGIEPARRCIWLTMDEALDRNLAEAYFAAPADPAGPHGVVRVAITNAYYDARNAGETMETAADNARDAVLRALGWEAPA